MAGGFECYTVLGLVAVSAAQWMSTGDEIVVPRPRQSSWECPVLQMAGAGQSTCKQRTRLWSNGAKACVWLPWKARLKSMGNKT